MRRPITTLAAVVAAGLAFTAFAFQPEAGTALASASVITFDPAVTSAAASSQDPSLILGALTFLAAMGLCSVQGAPRRRTFAGPSA
jgi:hypothetical protein